MGILDELKSIAGEENESTDNVDETVEPVQEQDDQIEASAEGETAPEQEQPEVESEEETTESEEPKEYVPNYSYKAMGEEREIPDWAKGAIKDSKTEEEVRKVFAKADGLDHYAEKHGKLETSYAELQTEYDSKMRDAVQLAKVVQNFNQKVASSDMGQRHSALVDAGIKDDQILDVARHILELRKLTPQQRQAYDHSFVKEREVSQYEERIASQDQKLKSIEFNQAKAQLDAFASTKADLVKEYESREGVGAGDFTKDFIDFGATLQNRLGKELNFDEAFLQFKKIHNLGAAKPTAPKPKVLPNLKSTGHSPISKGFKSLDDLRTFMDKN